MRSVDRNELKEILHKNWMTHDAMWFLHCLQECGIEKTNKINRAAVKSMSKIEIKRMAKALGVERITNFEEFKAFFDGVQDIVKADFMDFGYEFTEGHTLHMAMRQCFAYDGMKRIGAIDTYECGIFDRIQGWFEGMGISYSVTPKVTGCMMNEQGPCYRNYRFEL